MTRPGSVIMEVSNLSFAYEHDGPQILDSLSFNVFAGEVIGIIGSSGCGKSTLCLCLGGILMQSQNGSFEGDIFFEGDNIRQMTLPRISTKVGLVFQDPETQLFLPRVKNELAFGPENLCYEREAIVHKIEDIAGLLNIKHLLMRNPNQMSGGQQQLTALAAVLTLDPEVLILDEAASQLDQEGQKRLLEAVRLLKARGKTIIMVDHHLERLKIADRIIALHRGRIAAEGSYAEIIENEAVLDLCFFDSACG